MRRCDKVVGTGFQPLHGSTMLQEFDVSRAIKHRTSQRNQIPKFSPEAVVPVLLSILDVDGHSLREVSLPPDWMKTKVRNELPLSDFFARYSQLKQNEEVKCKDPSCSRLVQSTNENSCPICCARICAACERLREEDEEGWYDDNEFPFIKTCDRCSQGLCNSCGLHRVCRKCNSVYCSVCAKVDGIDAASYCESDNCESWEPLCLRCRVPEDADGCWGCQHLVYPKLLEEKESLATEVEKLRNELAGKARLEEEIEELQNENKELHRKIEDDSWGI